jgi:coproporphyrinogen III oxidase-like Fe-S oxidoreductase
MEIDINIVAHDLLWRRMDIRRKQEYVKSWGSLKAEIIEKELARLIDDGYAIQHDGDLELTAEGNVLYKRMTTRCPKTD